MRYLLYMVLGLFLGLSSYCSIYGLSGITDFEKPKIEIIDYQIEKDLERDLLESSKELHRVEILSTKSPYFVPVNFKGKKRNKDELIMI